MKRSEMNQHQLKAFNLVVEAMSEFIGGHENNLEDFGPEEEEYKEAEKFLGQGHETLKQFFTDYVMQQLKRSMRTMDANFAGRAFVEERVDRRLTKFGY